MKPSNSSKEGSVLGVMQGRLAPKYLGRYQAHPKGYWQSEFPQAAELGLDSIEFILDFEDAEENPLLAPGGEEAIRASCMETGVAIRSICADYFMLAPLHTESRPEIEARLAVLTRLIARGSAPGATEIVIPCVDSSAMPTPEMRASFARNLRPIWPIAEKFNVNLALETDLPPEPFRDLVMRLESPRATVNYDIGNSASLGYNPAEEFAAYGDRITDVHIKDRVLGGGSVTLGEGDADFDRVFGALADRGYRGLFVMQAFRDDEGLEIFRRQLEWVLPYVEPFRKGIAK